MSREIYICRDSRRSARGINTSQFFYSARAVRAHRRVTHLGSAKIVLDSERQLDDVFQTRDIAQCEALSSEFFLVQRRMGRHVLELFYKFLLVQIQ